MEANERVLAMLKTALDMEEKGRRFYEQAIITCTAAPAVEIFRMLRDDEIVHTTRIHDIFRRIQGGTTWLEGLAELAVAHSDLSAMMVKIAAKHGKTVETSEKDVQAIDVGIDFEAAAVSFYKDRLGAATEPVERRFLQAMVVEEETHHQALVDMKLYLTDPAAWFAEKEGAMTDGG